MLFIQKVAAHLNNAMMGNVTRGDGSLDLINVVDRILSGGRLRPRDLELLRDEKMRVIIDAILSDGPKLVYKKTYGDMVSRYHKITFRIRPPVDLVIEVLNALRELGVLQISEKEVCRLRLDAAWLKEEAGWLDICNRCGYPNLMGAICDPVFAAVKRDENLEEWEK